MKHLIAIAMLILGPASAHAQTPQKPAAECGVISAKYMDLSFNEFDQTEGAGWREIAGKPGCQLAAADLIAEYRERALDKAFGLDWHEAQARAVAGQTEKALELFRRDLAYEKSLPAEHRSDNNILKAEATIAFLEGDLNTLRAKRAELAAMPKPDGFEEAIAKFKKNFPGAPPPEWPLNLSVVDGLIHCFGKPYAVAYGDCGPSNTSSEPAVP